MRERMLVIPLCELLCTSFSKLANGCPACRRLGAHCQERGGGAAAEGGAGARCAVLCRAMLRCTAIAPGRPKREDAMRRPDSKGQNYC